jgi:Uma2 family endonuclease
MTAFTLQLNSVNFTDEQFFKLCQANQDLRFERTAQGDLIIMPPTGSSTGNRNAGLTAQLWLWNDQSQLGFVFDSSTGFKLPNGANRSPDAAWIERNRWNSLTEEQQERFAPICPDVIVELMSPNDALANTQAKMREYLANGARLGWLIDRQTRQVEIYRPHQPVEVLENPTSLSGEDVLPEFVLQMASIW